MKKNTLLIYFTLATTNGFCIPTFVRNMFYEFSLNCLQCIGLGNVNKPPETLDFSNQYVNVEMLKGKDLRFAKFDGSTLEGIDLSGYDLQGASFKKTDMTGAALINADIRGADFTDSKMVSANLYKVIVGPAFILSGTVKEPLEFDFSFGDENLYFKQPTIFDKADMENSNLGNSFLFETTFIGANLSNANLTNFGSYRSNFKNANLKGSDLSNADVDESDFSNANMQEINMNYSMLNKSNFSNANFQKANINYSMLNRSDFFNANLQKSNINYSILNESNFSNTNLPECNLVQVIGNQTTFSNANMQKVNLNKANFEVKKIKTVINTGLVISGSLLIGSNVIMLAKSAPKGKCIKGLLMGILLYKTKKYPDNNFKGANLSHANLRDTKLEGVELRRANLQGANLIKTNIKDTNLRGVRLDRAVLALDLTIPGGYTDQQILSLYQSTQNVHGQECPDTLKSLLLTKGLISLEKANPELTYPNLESIDPQ